MQSIEELFEKMHDIDFPYCVLRNFENLPHDINVGDHDDLDLLVYDFDHFKELFPNITPVYSYPRVRFRALIGDIATYMDIRHVGDGYYPTHFEQEMLNTREYNSKGFFTPNPYMFRMGLVYHAVHHKNFNKYQRWIGENSIEDMLEALKQSQMGYTLPKDPSVGRYNQYWKGATAVVSKEGGHVVKKQTGWGDYDLIDNEYRILSQAASEHFPSVLNKTTEGVELEDCGEIATVYNLPDNWKQQLVQIMEDLKDCGIQHRDIKPDNLMVKDNIIKLIDFGWARFDDDPEDSPPECLGYPYKPSYGFDDNFSMRKVIKEFEFKFEEMTCESLV